MRDNDKTKAQLIAELSQARRRVAELEALASRSSRSEEDLHGQVLFMQQVLDALPIPVYYMDTQGRYAGCNSVFAEFIGLSKEAIVGKTVYDIAPPETAEAYHQADMALLRQPGRQVYEAASLFGDRRMHDVVLTKATYVDNQGRVTGLVGALLDITNRKRVEEDLKNANKQLEAIIAFLPDPIFIIDKDSRVIAWNHAMEEMTGTPASEIIGQGDYALPFYHEPRPMLIDLVLRPDPDIEKRYAYLHREGDSIYGEIPAPFIGRHLFGKASPIYDEAGRITGAIESIRDITDWKKAEDALKQSEERYRALFEEAMEGIFQTTLEGRIIIDNSAMTRMLGYDSHDEARERITDIASQIYADPEDRRRLIDRLVREGRVTGSEVMFKRADGRLIKVLLNLRLVRDRQGSPAYIEGSCIDITAIERAQAALKESEAKYRTIFENAIEGIFQSKPEGRPLSLNPAMAGMFGYDSPQEMLAAVQDIGQELYVHPEDRTRLLRMLADRDKVEGFEVEMYRRDKSRFWMSVNIHTVRDAAGKILYLEGTNMDITKRKRAEITLRDSEARYRMLFESANDGVFIVKGDRFWEFNTKTLELYGCRSEQILGRTPYDFSPPAQPDGSDSKAKAQEKLRAALEGRPQIFAWKHRRLDGTLFDAEVSLSRVELGGELYIQGIVRDVTARKQAEERLHESDTRYRELYSGMMDAFARVDMHGAIKEFNAAYRDMLGYDDDELRRLTYQDLTPPQWLAFEEDIIQRQVVGRGYSDLYEKEYRRKDGTVIPVELRTYLLRDKEGRPTGMWGILRDISARKQAEQALRESERHLADIIDFLPDATLVIDRQGKITAWNKAMENMSGFSAGEMIGKGDYEYAIPFYGERRPILIDTVFMPSETIEEQYSSINRQGDLLIGETDAPVVKGRKRFLSGWAHPIYNTSGEVVGAIECIRDITEKHRDQEALGESEARYRLLTDNASDIIFTLNKDLRFTYISPSVERIRGYTVAEAMAQTMEETLTPASLEAAMQAFQEELKIATASPQDVWRTRSLELEELCKDGSTIWTETSFTPLRDHERRLVEFIGITRDITERKRAEKEHKMLEAQLAQAQKMESIGTLAGGIAHDFNNILSSVFGFTELAKLRLSGGENVERELDEVLKAAVRARDLVKQILTFSRKADIQREPLELSVLIKETIKFIRASLPATIEIRQDLRAPGSMILADPTQVHQILMNLCTNAAQAMKEKGGLIEIQLAETDLSDASTVQFEGLETGRYVQLSIADNGYGISPEIIDKIFDPFFTTKPRGEGTGMGLSVVHGIVKDMRGAISVLSEPGQGTTFHILFPKFEVLGEKKAADYPSTAFRKGRGRVLFVDDEEGIVASCRGILEQLGYEVVSTNSPLDAIEIFQAAPAAFDCVLTDMTMPRMTGVTLAERLKTIRSDIPIVLCTGFSLGLTEERIKKAGIREMVMKPIVASKLAEAVYLAMHPGSQPANNDKESM